jgi:hypothetical protein
VRGGLRGRHRARLAGHRQHASGRHRIRRVEHQVHHDLLQRGAVDDDLGQAGREVEVEHDVGGQQPAQHRLQLADHGADVEQCRRGLTAPGEGQELARELSGPVRGGERYCRRRTRSSGGSGKATSTVHRSASASPRECAQNVTPRVTTAPDR